MEFDLESTCPCFGLAAMVSPINLVTEVTQQLNLKTVVDNTNRDIQVLDCGQTPWLHLQVEPRISHGVSPVKGRK